MAPASQARSNAHAHHAAPTRASRSGRGDAGGLRGTLGAAWFTADREAELCGDGDDQHRARVTPRQQPRGHGGAHAARGGARLGGPRAAAAAGAC